MKKIVVIAVLLVFLVNTMGYYIVFEYSQYRIKQEMASQLRMGLFHPDLVLLKIKFPEKESHFRRIEKNEFSYYGKMYDVVIEHKSGDTTLFYCIHDKKEESLLADFTIYLRRTGRSGSSSKDNPLQALLHNLVTQALLQKMVIPLRGPGVAIMFSRSKEQIIPVYLAPFAPPPELA